MTARAGPSASRRDRPPLRSTSTLPFTLSTLLIAALALLLTLAPSPVSAQSERHRGRRDFRALSDEQVGAIAQLAPAEWDSVDGGHLEHLLVERVSGTDGNTRVQEYISSVFKGLGWHEDKYATTMDTPLGERPFTNLVYTFDPDAPRRLVLSAHFDSKWFPDGGFIGATDSAAPCAFMLDVAESLTPLLKSRAARLAAGTPLLTAHMDELEAGETTLQLVFFDGEEAFHKWTRADSVYGSRHLAATWEDTLLPPHHPLARRRMAPTPNVLDTIDVLVLLDLLGARGPRLQSYYRETDWLFEEMRSADTRLRAAGLVEGKEAGWFIDLRGYAGMIDDDHRPFLERGVPVLHVIPNPFPHVWHKQFEDDAKALDLPTLRRWVRILRVFTAGYLGLAPDDDVATASRTNGTASAEARNERDEL